MSLFLLQISKYFTLDLEQLEPVASLNTIASDELSQGRSREAPAEEENNKAEPPEPDPVVHLSRREAKQALLVAGSNLERAARQAQRDRLAKVEQID